MVPHENIVNRFTLALLGCLALAGCKVAATPAEASEHSRDFIQLDPKNPKLNFIKVEVVEESDAAPSVHLTGRVTFDEDHTQRIASPIDGRVTQVLVALGDTVKRDQSVVLLSSGRAAEMTADAQKTEQDLSLAQKSLERATKLKQEGAISDKDVAQVEADYKKAKADAARSAAQLHSLSLSTSGPTITAALRSQIAGTVVERSVLVGQEVRADATAPLLTVTDLSTVWVVADLYEKICASEPWGGGERGGPRVPVRALPGDGRPRGRGPRSGQSHGQAALFDPQPRPPAPPATFAKVELPMPGGGRPSCSHRPRCSPTVSMPG